MLVLTRKRHEQTQFVVPEGTQIPAGGLRMSVTLLEIHNGSVRIGFDAPKNIPIRRAEVQAAIDA